MKNNYFNSVVAVLIAIMATEAFVCFLIAFFNPQNAIPWHYFSFFFGIMIVGGVFFWQRVLWEIDKGILKKYEEKTLSSRILGFSIFMVLAFFLAFFLPCYYDIWRKIPNDFQPIFHYPVLFSGVFQLALTIFGFIARNNKIIASSSKV